MLKIKVIRCLKYREIFEIKRRISYINRRICNLNFLRVLSDKSNRINFDSSMDGFSFDGQSIDARKWKLTSAEFEEMNICFLISQNGIIL